MNSGCLAFCLKSSFNTQHLKTEGETPSIAVEAACLRAIYTLRTPDAIQHAAAIIAGATHFLTIDARLKLCHDLQVLVVDDLKP